MSYKTQILVVGNAFPQDFPGALPGTEAWEVRHAAGAEQAVEALMQHSPDAVILAAGTGAVAEAKLRQVCKACAVEVPFFRWSEGEPALPLAEKLRTYLKEKTLQRLGDIRVRDMLDPSLQADRIRIVE